MPSQLWRGPGHGAWDSPQLGLVFLKRAAYGGRGGPEQEEVSAGICCVLVRCSVGRITGLHLEPAVGYYSMRQVLAVLAPPEV